MKLYHQMQGCSGSEMAEDKKTEEKERRWSYIQAGVRVGNRRMDQRRADLVEYDFSQIFR